MHAGQTSGRLLQSILTLQAHFERDCQASQARKEQAEAAERRARSAEVQQARAEREQCDAERRHEESQLSGRQQLERQHAEIMAALQVRAEAAAHMEAANTTLRLELAGAHATAQVLTLLPVTVSA